MKYSYLSESVNIKTISENEKEGVFEISGLYTGYGLTIGNALRRVLLSSLPGAAITQIKIKGVSHEFSTITGVSEDVVEIISNLKNIRFELFTDEPQVVSLKVKGEKKVKAGDIELNPEISVGNPEAHIATLTSKSAEFDVEITVEKGLGFSPSESRRVERLPIGTIIVDALFSPVVKVNYTTQNMRVGERTDYDRLTLTIETDGTIAPSVALRKSSSILKDHFMNIFFALGGAESADVVSSEEAVEEEVAEDSEKEEKPKAKKKAKK